MMWYPYGWGGMLWMGLGMVFWAILLGLAIWLLVRWLARSNTYTMPPYAGGSPPSPPSALEILRQRYARGEIDAETYETMRAHLEKSAPRDDRLQPV
jgi:putative membrane protein